jgi:hypothetical protein
MPAITVTPPAPHRAAAGLRAFAVAVLGYALGLADRAALDPEHAAGLLASALYREPPPRIREPAELAAQARTEAAFLALLHGPATLVERDGVWTQTVSLASDRAALERFGVPLECYADWTASLDRARQRGLGRETVLEADRLQRRLWLEHADRRRDT